MSSLGYFEKTGKVVLDFSKGVDRDKVTMQISGFIWKNMNLLEAQEQIKWMIVGQFLELKDNNDGTATVTDNEVGPSGGVA